jgi:hypothetical protein
MTGKPCTTPIDEGSLLAYWLGELDAAEDARIGEHLLGCGSCTTNAQWIADLGAGIRTLVREGAIYAVLPPAFLQRTVDAGMRVREYRLSPGTSVNCTLAPDDDLLVTRLQATLAGTERIDLLMLDAQGLATHRLADIPFDPMTGEVLLTSRIADVREMPETRFTMRLVAPESGGDRAIGDYAFHHRPWPGHPKA